MHVAPVVSESVQIRPAHQLDGERDMQIKKDTWHYRWIAHMWDEKPKALCWYCQKLIISIFIWIGAAILAVIAGSFIGWVLTIPFWQWFFPNFGDGLLSVLSLIGWLAIGALASYQYRQYLYDFGELTRSAPKEPGVVSQYVHAKHRKICPLLEYEQ